MTGFLVAMLAFVAAAATSLPLEERIEGKRAVERTRYAFVLNATKPFDEVYPRTVFEKKVRREIAEENVLRREFGMEVTPEFLAAEYDRIERETRAPDQWEAVKKSLGGDRRRIEQVVCRPLLVDRALRARFAFDPKIHAKEHQNARESRNAFLDGKTPPGARPLRLARGRGEAGSTDDLLKQTQADAKGMKVLAPLSPDPKEDRPVPVDPEMARVLEKELKANGDVTTILEERGRFSIFRLVAADPSEWLVDAVQIPKRDFDRWFESRIPNRPVRASP